MKLIEVAFFTRDVIAMTDFYHHLLDIKPIAQSDNMAIFAIGETKIFIHSEYTPKDGELSPENHYAFLVDDIDDACNKLIQQGLLIETPPQEFYWGRSAYLRDPDGHQIEITQKDK